jgi:hypothetical protein
MRLLIPFLLVTMCAFISCSSFSVELNDLKNILQKAERKNDGEAEVANNVNSIQK